MKQTILAEKMKKTIGFVFLVLVLAVGINASTFVGVMTGTLKGAWIEYDSTSSIKIKTGYGDCNGNYWEISSDVTLSSLSLTGEDFYSVYIDDSDASYPLLSTSSCFATSTDEPSWSDSKQGWYRASAGNQGDRCIGTFWVKSNNEIYSFQWNEKGEYIVGDIKTVLSGGNPNGTWQTVTCNAYIPVIADAVYINASNSHTSGNVYVSVGSFDNTTSNLLSEGYNTLSYVKGWLSLQKGGTRDLKWYGFDTDNNSFNIVVQGFRISR